MSSFFQQSSASGFGSQSATQGCCQQQQQQQQQSSSSFSGLRAATAILQAASRQQQNGSVFGGAASRQQVQQQQQGQRAAVQAYQSNIEQQIINAKQPIEINEREQATAGQYQGTLLNRAELAQFRGPVPLEQYRINDDSNPEIIRKRLDKIRYQQEVAVRYLNPPALPRPGDIIIKERQSQIPPAPPVVLRQEGERASTPAPLIMRQRPPQAPAPIPQQVVEVEGTPVPPPARRVVLEKLTSLPPKPQNVIIEKWLPYQPQKRRVVLQRSCAQAPQNPRNLIIEWEAPEVEVERVCRNLGVIDADPEDYIRRYGAELKDASELPTECDGERPQVPARPQPAPAPLPVQSCGCSGSQGEATSFVASAAPLQQAFQSSRQTAGSLEVPELEGDLDALRRVDLERNNLGQYRAQLGQ